MQSRKFDLEERLIDFGVLIIEASEKLPKTAAGKHLADQLLRSGTAPALLYGEAQAAESKKDFIHKLEIAYKEARETRYWLRLLNKSGLLENNMSASYISECEEIMKILSAILNTSKGNGN